MVENSAVSIDKIKINNNRFNLRRKLAWEWIEKNRPDIALKITQDAEKEIPIPEINHEILKRNCRVK